MKSAGAALVELLSKAGVRRFYTVPGESFLDVLDAVECSPELKLISARHESGAAFMAEADAKVSGRPAVALASRGVGAANLSIGVHTAYQDSTPMLVVLGQVETEKLGREAFQEIDLTAFYLPITKWAKTVHRSDRVAEYVSRALRIAMSGRPGPAMVAIPSDLFGHPADDQDFLFATERALSDSPNPAPSPQEIDLIARRLEEARRPIVIAGGGARSAREALIRFAESCGAGVYASFRRQDVFPNDHPLYLGHLSFGLPEELLEGLRQADLIVVIGSRLDEITTQGYSLLAHCDVVHIDEDALLLDSALPGATGVVADCAVALQMLLSRIEFTRRGNWQAARARYVDWSTIPNGRSADGVDPTGVIAAMKKVFPEDVVVTNDAGNFSSYLHRFWTFNQPGTQVAPTSGAMGYAVPAAVGAKVAAPSRSVLAVAGDGGFLMSGQEIETAVRYELPITVVVFKNGLQGTIAMHQAREFGRLSGVVISDVDIAGLASSLGGRGMTVTAEEDLVPAFTDAHASQEVAVVEVVTNPDLITPTSHLSDLFRRDAPSDVGVVEKA